MAVSKKTATAIASGVLALGAGIGVANMAAADTTSGTPSPGADRGWAGHSGRGLRAGDFVTELANKLGIDEAKVAEALRAIRAENQPRPDPTTRPDVAEREAALAKALSSKLGIDETMIKTALQEIRAAHQAERAAALGKARCGSARRHFDQGRSRCRTEGGRPGRDQLRPLAGPSDQRLLLMILARSAVRSLLKMSSNITSSPSGPVRGTRQFGYSSMVPGWFCN